MANIQDIRALEMCITDIVDDYIQQQYNEDDVLATSHRCGRITLKADTCENIKVEKATAPFPLRIWYVLATTESQKPTATRFPALPTVGFSWIE